MDDEDSYRPGEAGYLVQRFLLSEVSHTEFDRSGILFFPTELQSIYTFEERVDGKPFFRCVSALLGIPIIFQTHPQQTRFLGKDLEWNENCSF